MSAKEALWKVGWSVVGLAVGKILATQLKAMGVKIFV